MHKDRSRLFKFKTWLRVQDSAGGYYMLQPQVWDGTETEGIKSSIKSFKNTFKRVLHVHSQI